MNAIDNIIEHVPVPCPKCGKVSDSIKCYSLPDYLLFIGIYAAYSFKKEVCCPHCMRKQILIKYFTYNIVIGNFLWLLIGLPLGIWKFCSSFTAGHSASVKKILAEQFAGSRQPTDAQPTQSD